MICIAFENDNRVVTVSSQEEYAKRMAFVYVTIREEGKEPKTRQWCYSNIEVAECAVSVVESCLKTHSKFYLDDLRNRLYNIDTFEHSKLFKLVYGWRLEDPWSV